MQKEKRTPSTSERTYATHWIVFGQTLDLHDSSLIAAQIFGFILSLILEGFELI